MPILSQSLSNWRLKDFDVGNGEAARAFGAPIGDGEWIDIKAPGDVYLALHNAGRTPHPFDDRTEEDCAWVRDREWWQRTDFVAPKLAAGQRLVLTFEGLDTLVTVWLNGTVVGSMDNMFRALSIDITDKVRQGQNQLAVRFTPTTTVETDYRLQAWRIFMTSERNFVRKAQFGWGWDWGPDLPTVGIWKPVKLEVQEAAAIRTVKFTTYEIAPDHSEARISIALDVDNFTRAAVTATYALIAPDGSMAKQGEIALTDGKGAAEVTLANPQLWWTPELGDPNLYRLSVSLEANGAAVDDDKRRVGIRTVKVDTSVDPDEAPATFFRFKLNGVSIFARGSCWIPASSFVAEVDEAHYRRLLGPAVRANMNMMRVWGGGVYEHDSFYDICDELGLLVWQDFMFACAPYPETSPDFVANVDAELRFQIERLRNHPSLALWCANNEVQVIHEFMNQIKNKDYLLQGDLYFRKMMPETVAELDPTTPYWPGSPTGGPVANSMQAGDVHSWTVWHGAPPIPVDRPIGEMSIAPESVAYTRYAEEMSRFVSEYGIHGAPVMETLRRSLPEDQRQFGSEALLHRVKDHPKDKVNAMLVTVTGLPTTLEEYVDFTQITQAEGLKFGIEHFRRRTPHCSGSLIWQYNDCWPCVSWSLVDYYGFGKASFFYVTRAYAPVMASFKTLDDGAIELWIVNDRKDPVSGLFHIALHAFAGGEPWDVNGEYEVPATTSVCVWTGTIAASPKHVLRVTAPDGIFPANRHFFAAVKDLDRGEPVPPEIRKEVISANEVAVHIKANAYIWFVHLLTSDEATIFTDNYVDIPQGEIRTIMVRNDVNAIAPDDIDVRWR